MVKKLQKGAGLRSNRSHRSRDSTDPATPNEPMLLQVLAAPLGFRAPLRNCRILRQEPNVHLSR